MIFNQVFPPFYWYQRNEKKRKEIGKNLKLEEKEGISQHGHHLNLDVITDQRPSSSTVPVGSENLQRNATRLLFLSFKFVLTCYNMFQDHTFTVDTSHSSALAPRVRQEGLLLMEHDLQPCKLPARKRRNKRSTASLIKFIHLVYFAPPHLYMVV